VSIINNIFGIVENGVVLKYPVNPSSVFPNVSFSEDFAGGVIDSVEFVVVESVSPPETKMGWQYILTNPVYDKNKKVWKQNWEKQYIGDIKLKMCIADKRFFHEINGIFVGDNYFKTDRVSQTKYSIMALNEVKTHWKIDEFTFIEVDIKDIDKRVREFVHECFETERKFFEIVDTGDLEIIANTDFESGWPSNKE